MNNPILDIQNIKKSISEGKIYWTYHCLNRLNKRNIKLENIENAINNGKIIEYYNNDYPYPSCLILGNDINNEILHIVCGINKDIIYIITAYHPNTDKWEEDMKTRRKDNELY